MSASIVRDTTPFANHHWASRAITRVLMTAFVITGGAASSAAETHPFSVHDMLAMQRISEPKAAPDGSKIVFSLRVTDLEANKGRTNLWLMNADGSGLRQLTSHSANSTTAEWAPDGKSIFFLSARSDSMQVWRLPIEGGGEAQQVTKLPLDVGSFRISPDGGALIVSLEVFADLAKPSETKARLDELAKKKSTGKLYERLFIRHWDTWKDGRRSHLFYLPLAAAGGGGVLTTAPGQTPKPPDPPEPIDLMKGIDADCPGKPFGGSEDYTFTPDGKSVVFAARNVGREEAWSTDFDLFLVPVTGGAPKNLTPENKALLAQPTFSPNGQTLAYLAMVRPGYEADRQRIALMPWPDGKPRMLTESWDRSASGIAWSRDGKAIITHADHLGNHPLFAVDAASGEVRQLVESGHIAGLTLAGDRIVYGLNHLRSPVELYSVSPEGGASTQLTKINAGALAACRMGEPEQFQFKGWNDEPVYAWVVKPADFDPAKKYPVAFLIHGGPQGSFGNDFHYRWNPQAYAGRGYAAVMVDFHASTGYGQAFTDAVNHHWGDRPLEDLQKGLKAALDKYPWMDGQRVAALGASFGGYMINWIAGNWADRFRCLVNHDGNLDERLAYFDTEELWFPEWEHGGTPWENPEGYTKFNPIDLVKNWRTPMLVIHGGQDFRVVDTQGISTYSALQRKGIPSQFLYFPDENHWVLKPANSILWHETVLAWLDRWCKQP